MLMFVYISIAVNASIFLKRNHNLLGIEGKVLISYIKEFVQKYC